MNIRIGWMPKAFALAAAALVWVATSRPAAAQETTPKSPAAPSTEGSAAPQMELRGIWVPAPSAPLNDPASCGQMVAEVRSARFNTIFIQVLSTGEAFYNSAMIPAAASVNPTNPDPLASVLKQAKPAASATGESAKPLQVVAALDLLRAHSMATRSRPAPGSVLALHPDWAMLNRSNKAVTSDQFMYLDPGLETVRTYLANVVRELVTNYQVDGVFLSGLHYPDDTGEWGYTPGVLEEFRNQFPDKPDRPAPNDPDWIKFRQTLLETLVAQLANAVNDVRDSCQVFVAADVVGPPPASLEDFQRGPVASGLLQNWVSWGRTGEPDWICLKDFQSYERREQAFESWALFAAAARFQSKVCIGIDGSQNFNSGILNQIRFVQNSGIAGIVLYDYQQPTVEDRATLMTGLAKTLFAEERQVVRLLNIEYKPPVVPTAAGAQPTTPTLMSQPTTSTLGMVPGAAPTTGTVALQPAETEAVVEVYPTATPAPTETPVPPTPTLSPLVATPSPAAAPMQSFRLRNGLTFKGRIILDVENQVTIVTEDGTQLKIPKSQIVSPSLESKP